MRRTIYILTACWMIVSLSIGAFLPTGPRAFAATPSNITDSSQALEIAPPVVYLKADPGQTVKAKIFLRDVSNSDLIVSGEANDFTAGDENGTPKILLNGDNDNPYSLKNWITVPASLLLVPREVKTMEITIRVPTTASPGGHYGVIRFTGHAPSLEGSGVSLSASLGALILLTVNGNAKESMTLKEFSVNKDGKTGTIFEGAPLNFVERVENSGNIHEQPDGVVTITDMFGKTVATLGINHPPRNILPASIRKFEEPLNSGVIGNKRLFGRYKAVVEITYGKDKQKLTSSMTFWVIPYKLIAIIIAILIAGFFALRYGIRRYNRYIIGRSGGTTPAARRTEKPRRRVGRRRK